MKMLIDYDELDGLLRQCGSNWNVGQTHGLLCSQLAVSGEHAAAGWLQQVLDGSNASGARHGECVARLEQLLELTYRQLAERLSDFAPLLPNDLTPRPDRTEAMGNWCEGFLHGLVSGAGDEALKKRLAEDPLKEIIQDLVQVTRVTVDANTDSDIEDEAYTEIFEYLRVVAQMVFEELADHREPASPFLEDGGAEQVLH